MRSNLGDIDLHTNVPDHDLLLQRMIAGDMGAFDELYKLLQPKVFRYISPFTINTGIEANDVIQDIFVKVWMKREMLAGITSLEHYLYRMARNRLIDLKRSIQSRQTHEYNLGSVSPITAETTEYEIQYREYSKIAREGILRLPERRRKIFELSVEKDLSIPELSDFLKLSTEVIKKQLYLASREVRRYIEQHKLLILPFLLLIRFID